MPKLQVEWVEDLIWYDGPLLSLVKDGEQHFLDLWVDSRQGDLAPEGFHYKIDVRCLVQISNEDLKSLLDNKLPLRDAIERSPSIVHFVGSTGDAEEIKPWSAQEMKAYGCMPEPGVMLMRD